MIRLLYQFPTALQRLYRGVVWRKKRTRPAAPSSEGGGECPPVVYLTFDDGPIPEITPRVLEILAREQVHATFFMVGDNVDRYPELYRRVRAEGHTVGNHTYNHLKGPCTRTCDYMDNVHRADEVLHTRSYRPPYGRLKYRQKRALLREGYRIYLWDVLTHDYNPNYSPERMMAVIRRYTRNGSIINFHDSLKSGDRMLRTLAEAIPWLKSRGYTFDILD